MYCKVNQNRKALSRRGKGKDSAPAYPFDVPWSGRECVQVPAACPRRGMTFLGTLRLHGPDDRCSAISCHSRTIFYEACWRAARDRFGDPEKYREDRRLRVLSEGADREHTLLAAEADAAMPRSCQLARSDTLVGKQARRDGVEDRPFTVPAADGTTVDQNGR